MPKYDPLILATYKILSQKIPKIEPFYQKTACINREEREILGYIEAYKVLFGEDDPTSKDLTKYGEAIRKIGISKWLRTEWTNLGLFIGETLEKDIEFPKSEETTFADTEETS